MRGETIVQQKVASTSIGIRCRAPMRTWFWILLLWMERMLAPTRKCENREIWKGSWMICVCPVASIKYEALVNDDRLIFNTLVRYFIHSTFCFLPLRSMRRIDLFSSSNQNFLDPLEERCPCSHTTGSKLVATTVDSIVL